MVEKVAADGLAEAEVVVEKVTERVVVKVFPPVKAVGSLNKIKGILTTLVSVFVVVYLIIKRRIARMRKNLRKYWKSEKKPLLREIKQSATSRLHLLTRTMTNTLLCLRALRI